MIAAALLIIRSQPILHLHHLLLHPPMIFPINCRKLMRMEDTHPDRLAPRPTIQMEMHVCIHVSTP
jgi:hypothetical protein